MTLRDSYERRGVALVESLLSPGEVEELERALDVYSRDVLPRLPASDYVIEPDGKSVRNFWRMHLHDDYFRDLMLRADFREIVDGLVGSDAAALGVETFCKPARVGSAVPYHQDNAYFCRVPPDVVTLWIALDRVTADNGAIEYLPGSHGELLPHRPSGVKGNSFALAAEPPGHFEVYRPLLEPGDALLHHSQTIHRSLPNRSDTPRRSVVIVYRGRHTRVDPALQARYDEALATVSRDPSGSAPGDAPRS